MSRIRDVKFKFEMKRNKTQICRLRNDDSDQKIEPSKLRRREGKWREICSEDAKSILFRKVSF